MEIREGERKVPVRKANKLSVKWWSIVFLKLTMENEKGAQTRCNRKGNAVVVQVNGTVCKILYGKIHSNYNNLSHDAPNVQRVDAPKFREDGKSLNALVLADDVVDERADGNNVPFRGMLVNSTYTNSQINMVIVQR